jgi:hypothetical protein
MTVNQKLHRTGRVLIALAALCVLPAQAASIAFTLNQSNRLPDGTDYLSVTLTETGAGVNLTVTTLAPLNDIAAHRFGVRRLAFDFSDSFWLGHPDALPTISGLPDGWRVRHGKRMDGFGWFDVRLLARGKARTDSLSFTVEGVGLDDLGSLLSAQVTGLRWERCATTNAWFAGTIPTAPVPAPTTVMLLGSGLLGLAGFMRRKNS